MIEWKHEKKLIDYRFAEEAMSKRVDGIISNHKTELIWLPRTSQYLHSRHVGKN